MEVSMVIPTRNRPESLARLFGALVAQAHPPAEVLVVDSSDDRSYQAGLSAQFASLPLRWLTAEASVCIQRNVGIRAARCPWVWLCDDDIEPQADYLARLVAYAQATPEAGCITGWWVQKEADGHWHSMYPPSGVGSLTFGWLFQLSIWGDPADAPAPALLRGWKHYLVRYYRRQGNTLTRAGWPRVFQRTAPVTRAAVVSLGAALVRREWLLQAPYAEVLDPHGLGDNYGVAVQFPQAQPFHILEDVAVWHHHSRSNRLQATQAFYRRTLALHYFLRKQGASATTRLWYGWSLVGLGLRMLRSRNRLGLRGVGKLAWAWLWGRNAYERAARAGKTRVVPRL